MEIRRDDLSGMSAAAAKDYLFHHIAALKLTEKSRDELLADLGKWEKRVELARNRNAPELAAEAEREAERIRAKAETLAAEIVELRTKIETMRRAIPVRERTVDPDLLEQELLITLGKNPGDEIQDKGADRDFRAVEADAALEALKAKMTAQNPGPGNIP